jgi:tetratricopeptide (TPR) repeat protein
MDVDVFFQGYDSVFASGDQERIGDYLRRSLAEADKEGDRHAAVTVLNETAGYFRSTGKYAESLKAADRAVADMRDLGYEDTVPYGTTLLNAATAYRAYGDNTKALELFMEALAVLGARLPEDDYRLAGLFNNISSIYEKNGQYEQALEMLEKAAAIMEKQTGMESDAAVVLTNLAMTLFRLERGTEAEATLHKALALFKQENKTGKADQRLDPHYAAALAGMGEACYRMKRYAEAVENYEAALAHIRDAFGENRDYAVTCRNCALAYEAAGRYDKAGELRANAESLFAALGVTE